MANLPENRTFDYWVEHARRVVFDLYGDTVDVKPKTLLKFGRTTNADSSTRTTVAEFQDTVVNETYVSTNTIDTISSGSTNDTSIEVVIEGHTISGSEFTFVTQTATLNGQNKVTLTTPLCRATRLYNNSSSTITGPIYVYVNGDITAGKPDTATDTKLFLSAGRQQSEKCATAFSKVDYGLITFLYASVGRESNASTNVDIEIEIREFGKVFRPVIPPITLRTAGTNVTQIEFRPFIIVPKNSDVRVVATASADNTFVTAGFDALLATK